MAAGVAWWWPSAEPPAAPPAVALAVTALPPPAAVAASSVAAERRLPLAQTAPPPVTPAVPQIPRHRDPTGDLTPDLADYVNPGERPTMADVIQRLQAAGVRTGLAAFNPPGTRPPLIGLAVPENFELPPGYVRHHQATDDGQRIEPILMFAPDTPTLVLHGRTVTVPPDRVVPPELAPPGLPIRRIVVPAPADGPR
ncbi:MAG: hypothetical protein EKK53_07080 [Burkholderiales bacterium]|nr:MAG: hypothetical protein EKK53_07080 [Burkholderiales bacterium]